MLSSEKIKNNTAKPQGGLLAGAQILTMSGYVAVEDLTEGARIITRRGARILRALGQRDCMTRPINISPNTLGFSRPSAMMFVTPDQEILVRDWRAKALFDQDSVILPISRLVDDVLIYAAKEEEMHTVYTLDFDTTEVFYADGVEVVSGEMAAQMAPGQLTVAA